MIGAHTQTERDEVCGFDATVRPRENERRRTLRHIDGKGGGPVRGRKSSRAILDEGVTQHDLLVCGATSITESIDHLRRCRETLELEWAGSHAKGLSNPRLDEAKDAWHRTLRTATETEGLEKLGERRFVLRPALDHHDVGSRVAQGLRGLDERTWIGRSNACHDFGA